MIHTKQRFINRIGKRIYRNHSCDCPDCIKIDTEGLVIHDEQHAQHLYDVQNDYACEGFILDYRDELGNSKNLEKEGNSKNAPTVNMGN